MIYYVFQINVGHKTTYPGNLGNTKQDNSKTQNKLTNRKYPQNTQLYILKFQKIKDKEKNPKRSHIEHTKDKNYNRLLRNQVYQSAFCHYNKRPKIINLQREKVFFDSVLEVPAHMLWGLVRHLHGRSVLLNKLTSSGSKRPGTRNPIKGI